MFFLKNLMMSYSLNFSADNKRIQLLKTNSTSCTMSLDEVTPKDAGEWKLLIEAGKGAKDKIQEYHHHIALKINGNSFILFTILSIANINNLKYSRK